MSKQVTIVEPNKKISSLLLKKDSMTTTTIVKNAQPNTVMPLVKVCFVALIKKGKQSKRYKSPK